MLFTIAAVPDSGTTEYSTVECDTDPADVKGKCRLLENFEYTTIYSRWRIRARRVMIIRWRVLLNMAQDVG